MNLFLCGCCTSHGGGPVDWMVVTCPDCGEPCSCVGTVSDVLDRGTQTNEEDR